MELDTFKRDQFLDKPGIVGARWWQYSLSAAVEEPTSGTGDESRRSAIAVILGLGASALMATCLINAAKSGDDDEPIVEQPKPSLELQRSHGWAFGAASEPLVFDGATEKAFSADALGRLSADLAPTRDDLAPYAVRTLLMAPTSVPTQKAAADPAVFVPLESVLRPVSNAKTQAAFDLGRSIASLLRDVPDAAIVVDLPGPESVACAAGLADSYDVVFVLDNWPHPRGVVASHETLAVAAYYQPLFKIAREARRRVAPKAAPAFVLDAGRLATYVDASDRFDNRWVARMPGVSALKKLGVNRVLYVGQTALESDDLNDDFVAYERGGIEVRLVGPTEFGKCPGEPEAGGVNTIGGNTRVCFGGAADTHEHFFVFYPWRMPRGTPRAPVLVGAPWTYRARARKSSFSSGSTAVNKPVPAAFGTTTVVFGQGSGLLLGWTKSRTGTWNRAGKSWGGG